MGFLDIIDEAADAVGGTPLRIAVWVGVGLTAGLAVGSRGKETNRSIPNPIDLAIQSGDFDQAERMIRQTFPVSRQAEALAALRRIQEESGHRIEAVAQWNKRIGELVAAGDFDEAAAFVKSLDIDSAERKRILGEIHEAEKRKKAHTEWDRKITAFVDSGHIDKAMAFVNKLDLPSPHRDAAVTRLREMKREAETAAERRRNVEEWNRKIERLTSDGRFDEAIAFAGQIDIGPDERNQVIARLRALRRRASEQRIEELRRAAKGRARSKATPRKLKKKRQRRARLEARRVLLGPGADLEGADLNGANLQGTHLASAMLQGANLSAPPPIASRLPLVTEARRAPLVPGADLEGADLNGENLQGKNLSGANLRGANLTRADLEGTNLASAMLQGADLSQSKLRNAILDGALFDRETKWPEGFRVLRYSVTIRQGVLVNVLTRWVA